jgi:hypothetical protein
MLEYRKGWPALLGLMAALAAHGQSAPVQAVWKPEKITISYLSRTTYYSCDALETKMKRIVDQLGLVGEVRVGAANCAQGVVSMPNIHIEALVPAEASPAVLADLKKDESYRALVDRVNKSREQKVEAGTQFPAQWRDVQVGKGLDLTGSDCDLLREVQRQLLPKLAVKIKPTNRTCDSRDGPSLAKPFLDLQVLMPVATADKGA